MRCGDIGVGTDLRLTLGVSNARGLSSILEKTSCACACACAPFSCAGSGADACGARGNVGVCVGERPCSDVSERGEMGESRRTAEAAGVVAGG